MTREQAMRQADEAAITSAILAATDDAYTVVYLPTGSIEVTGPCAWRMSLKMSGPAPVVQRADAIATARFLMHRTAKAIATRVAADLASVRIGNQARHCAAPTIAERDET